MDDAEVAHFLTVSWIKLMYSTHIVFCDAESVKGAVEEARSEDLDENCKAKGRTGKR